MRILMNSNPFRYETEKLCRIFFPNEEFVFVEEPSDEEEGEYIRTTLEENETQVKITADACFSTNKKKSERIIYKTEDVSEKALERSLALCLYDCLTALTGYTPPWGILTGVRPAKLMSKYLSELGEEKAEELFIEECKVSPEKASLARRVAKKESEIIALSRNNSFSLYVSVPFCPSRCSYCSFVSHSNEAALRLIPEYTELLCREIRLCGEIVSRLGLRLESVYYGGGTPTALSAGQLRTVMKAVGESFDLSTAREYTVEAGRPDSITNEKLEVIRDSGADRISINPQTFDDPILELIGRKHTSRQTLEAFQMARNAGIHNINMDLIAGLPTDTPEGFARTLEITSSLAPESITVHTLALKRSSRLVTDEKKAVEAENIASMLSLVGEKLPPLGYAPYYMYRQSRSAGNMENVGWAKTGNESLYNVFMMEECHTVIGVGGASVTKLKAPGKNELERIFNFKYPYEYIGRFDEVVRRKERIEEFYASL